MSTAALEKLRRLIAKEGLGYYLVLSGDVHSSEYVSASDQRRAFITGFTGSAGSAVIGADYAELATDGRYWLQASAQLSPGWVLRKEHSPGVVTWDKAISARSKAEGVSIGVDPRLISYTDAEQIRAAGADLRSVEPNLVDQVWAGRPAEPHAPVYELSVEHTGVDAKTKITDLRHALKPAQADAIVLSMLDQIAWLLNLRGSDIVYNPVFKAFVLVTQGEVRLYIDGEGRDLPEAALQANAVEVRPYDAVWADVRALAADGQSVWVPSKSSWAMALAAGPRAVLDRPSPLELAKAAKNEVELRGAKRAQLHCGSSIVEHLAWLQRELRAGRAIDEHAAALKLLELRSGLPGFKGLSFETISSSGPNAAIVHYEAPAEGSRALSLSEPYLLDSGTQFLYGTTDTTRVAWFSQEAAPADVREAYTLVLKSHIALATAIFPKDTLGSKLDSIARQPLWRHGLNYTHGTGHGVGSFLNVHEGPVMLSTNAMEPVFEGVLLSNEPGFYQAGKFGVRIENLMVATRAHPKYTSNETFLQFETITLVPLDRGLLCVELLTAQERQWVNRYHARCIEKLSPLLSEDALAYLEYHCKPL